MDCTVQILPSSKRILFVDDEPRILDRLENMLFEADDPWETQFAEGGEEALEVPRKRRGE